MTLTIVATVTAAEATAAIAMTFNITVSTIITVTTVGTKDLRIIAPSDHNTFHHYIYIKFLSITIVNSQEIRLPRQKKSKIE